MIKIGKLIEYKGNKPVKLVEFNNEGVTKSKNLDPTEKTSCSLDDLECLAKEKIKEMVKTDKKTDELIEKEMAKAMSELKNENKNLRDQRDLLVEMTKGSQNELEKYFRSVGWTDDEIDKARECGILESIESESKEDPEKKKSIDEILSNSDKMTPEEFAQFLAEKMGIEVK